MGVFLIFAISCDKDDDIGDRVIDISAIPGVTPPAATETPVTDIPDTEQYTGTVSWSPADASFEYETEYTATITLIAKSGYTSTGITADFFRVEGAGSVSNNVDSGVITAVFPETYAYAIGDTGPAGGLIFYIDEINRYDWTYLEAAPNTWNGGTADPQAPWQATSTASNQFEEIGSDAQGISIGTGKTNTTAIANWLTTKGQTGHAAQIVDNLVFNGYDDWFLPSHDELNAMYTNLHDQGVGGFLSTYYWSSSEVQASYARNQDFYNGNRNAPHVDNKKSKYKHIRPIRAF